MAKGSSSNATTAASVALHPLTPAALEWFCRARRISPATLAKFPVVEGTVYFHDLKRKAPAVIFEYSDGWKARAYPDKAFTQRLDTKREFWNLAAVLAGPLEDVWIVEGELDACAMVESGIAFDCVLAAPSASGEGDDQLAYVGAALDAGLNKAKRFIWCGDQDEAGLLLRTTMVREFGTAKFHFVDWPEGSKDANDHLRTDGAVAVLELCRDGFRQWPVEGLYRLSEIPDSKQLTIWRPGFDEGEFAWGDRLLLAAGTLSVVTGHPGHGKTLLWTQIWQQAVHRHNLVACVASFETRPKPHLQRQLRTLYGRRLARHLDEDERRAADAWIDEHYRWLLHPERRPNLKWILDAAATAVIRHRVKILVIDPWNRLEAHRDRGEHETDYIGRCLRELYNFAVDFDCHVQIIAHPSKSESYRRGTVPELEDIAGSKHWDNMVDQGFVVHRPRLFNEDGVLDPYTELYHKKARFDELGHATKFGLLFDTDMGRYGACALRKRKRKDAAVEAEVEAAESESPQLPLPSSSMN
jgi:twinkle protein